MSLDLRNTLLFAGGDAIDRYGVLVKRTATWEESTSTNENLTRAGEATFVDRDGSTRTATTDIACVEWLSGEPTLRLYAASTGSTISPDTLYVPTHWHPIASAYYAKFKLRQLSTGDSGVFRLGSTVSTAGPSVNCYLTSTGGMAMTHVGSTGGVTSSTLAIAATTGQVVEALLNLRADGSVRGHVALDSGSITTGTASTANAPGSTWCANKLWIGSLGSTVDCGMNLYTMAVARSTRSMADMRLIE